MRRLSLRAVAAFTVPAFFASPAALAQYAASYGSGGDEPPAAIALFSDENFYGEIRDVFDPFGSLVDLSFNDRPRSVAVFAGQWELCEHKDFTGRCVFIREDVSDLGWFGLDGRVTSVRPVYEYTEASHGLMFTRDRYGYIRYADNEVYGYDRWEHGYATSWGISVSHYGYSPDYHRYGYYSPTWGYDPYGFAWGPRGTIRYTSVYRRHPRPSVINPYWTGWNWRSPRDRGRGHSWSWRDGRNDDWRRDGRGGRGDGRGDRDGRGGRGDWDGRGDRDGRDGRGDWRPDDRRGGGADGPRTGRDGRGDRDGRPGTGTVVTPVIPNDPRPGRGGGRDWRPADGRGGGADRPRTGRDGRGDRDGRGGRGNGTGAATGSVITPPATISRDPRPGRDGGGGDRDFRRRPGSGTGIGTPSPEVSRPGRSGRGGDATGLVGGPNTDGRSGRGGDRPRGRDGGSSGGGGFGRGGGGRSPVAASPPPPPPPPPAARDSRRDSRGEDRPMRRGPKGERSVDD